jgi:hypothetical protein
VKGTDIRHFNRLKESDPITPPPNERRRGR